MLQSEAWNHLLEWWRENELQMIMEQNVGYVEDQRTHMQENRSAYRPKKTETGVIADSSSYTVTGSMVKNREKRECEWKMAEDSMKKRPSTKMVKHSWIVMEKISPRKSQWNNLMKMIIGFVLFISIIRWIIMFG